MPTISCVHRSEADEATRKVYEDIIKTYGLEEPREIYLLMGHTPEYLAASWSRSRYLYGRDTKFTVKQKHVLTLGISATNNCEYCVRSHTTRLRQLGVTNEELAELLMVVDAVNGYDKFAEGTRAGDDTTIPCLGEGEADAAAEGVYDEIRKAYGNKEPEVIYRLMGYKPEYLRASWERSKLCFQEEGKLGLKLKHMIALCVAATNSNDYFVKAHTERLRELGMTNEEMVEILFIVDLVCGYNRYVQGLQVDPWEGQKKPWGPDAEANKAPSCCG